MKKSNIVMLSMLLIALVIISKAFITNDSIKLFLLIFFIVGCGLGLLRLFVNYAIKSLKGESIQKKILFFVVLLGLGLPFQTCFRISVLFKMDKAYLPRSIVILVTGVIFMTTFSIFLKDRKLETK